MDLQTLMKSENLNNDEGIIVGEEKTEKKVAELKNEIEVREEQKSLDPEFRNKINTIKEKTDLTNAGNIALFGSGAQEKISNYSKSVLEKTSAKDAGEIGETLSSLMATVKSTDVKPESEKGFLEKLFGRTKNKAEIMIAKQQDVETQLQIITSKLHESRYELLKDIEMVRRLYDENISYYDNLNAYIIAGKEIIEESNNNIIPAMFNEAELLEDEGQKSKAIQQIRDYQSNVNRFDKRIHDLQTSKTISMMMMPQLKIIEGNDLQLADKVQDAIVNVIPAWRMQILLSLGLDEQKRIAGLSKNITDTMGEMLTDNATKIYENSVEIKREVERDSVDIDKLEEANNTIIKTIEETLTIEEEAKKARKDSEERMEKMEVQLRESLLAAQKRKNDNLEINNRNSGRNALDVLKG